MHRQERISKKPFKNVLGQFLQRLNPVCYGLKLLLQNLGFQISGVDPGSEEMGSTGGLGACLKKMFFLYI